MTSALRRHHRPEPSRAEFRRSGPGGQDVQTGVYSPSILRELGHAWPAKDEAERISQYWNWISDIQTGVRQQVRRGGRMTVGLHPGCTIRAFPTGGHSLLITRTQDCIAAVTEFLEQV